MPTGPDLALLRELSARGVEYLLAGRVGAAVQGIELGWSELEFWVFDVSEALREAQRASGHGPTRGPEHSPVVVQAHPSPPFWRREWRRSVEVHVGDVPVRALALAAIVEGLRETFGTADDEAIALLEQVLEARGELAPYAPETRLGTLYGAGLSAVESALQSAGYVHSASGRAGTYSLAYEDVDGRSGMRSADLAYREDPRRPVAAEVARVLAARR